MLKKYAGSLIGRTTYFKKACDETAPFVCNCITAIRYLFAQATKIAIPKTWIGDLPRTLLMGEWKMVKITPKEVEVGDVIFLKNHNLISKITHMAVAVAANRFFHCTSKVDGCEIVDCETFHSRYEMITDEKLLSTYVDPRNH